MTRNTLALAIVQLANYLAPLVVLLYLTRTLGVDTYGVVAYAVGLIQLSLVILDFGFTLSATQKISVWRDNKPRVATMIGAIYVIKSIGFAAVCIAIWLYALLTDKYAEHSSLFLLALLPIFAQCFQPTWLFAAIERMKHIAVFAVTAKVLAVGLIVTLVADETDYLWVPVADGCAQLVALVIAVALVYRTGYGIVAPRWRDVVYTGKLTAGFFASRLAATAYSSMGVLLLGLFATPAAVAIYSLAEQAYRAIQSLFFPVVQALYPYMARERDLRVLWRVSAGSLAAAVAVAILGYVAAPLLIGWLFTAEWADAVPLINVFLLAITIHVLTVMSGYPLAAALRRLEVANRSVLFGAAVYALGAALVVAAGAATPMAFAWLMIVAESYVLLHRAIALWPSLAVSHSKQ